MKKDVAIEIKGISKVYKLYDKPVDRLKEALNPFKKNYHKNFHALKNVDIEIKKGEVLGIIGKNGAGKSTLLKILSGVLTPTSGTYKIDGNVTPLLQLGFGFSPHLTGLENIYFNGSVLGYSEEEMKGKIGDILEFANIGKFVNQPVRTYSTGMRSRLAFAVAINVDPDVLIVDEVLAVGDIWFRQKCFRKMREFRDKGKTILIVTHSLGAVLNYCDRALWLNDGDIEKMGSPEDVCREYKIFMTSDEEIPFAIEAKKVLKKKVECKPAKIVMDDVSKCFSSGKGGAEVKKVSLMSLDSNEKLVLFMGGQRVSLSVQYKVLRDIKMPIMGFVLKDKLGNNLLGFNTFLINSHVKSLNKGDVFVGSLEFDFPTLSDGDYSFDVGISDGTQEDHVVLHRVYDACVIKIVNKNEWGKQAHSFLVEDPVFKILK